MRCLLLNVAIFSASILGYRPRTGALHPFRYQFLRRHFTMIGAETDIQKASRVSDSDPGSLHTIDGTAIQRRDGQHLVACYPKKYDELLAEKVDRLKKLLSWTAAVDVHESPKEHFRMRANFQLWHDDAKKKTPQGLYYCMFEPGQSRKPFEVKAFPRGSLRINELMPLIMAEVHASPALFHGIFEIRYLTTQLNEAVVIMCYRKPLGDSWQAAADGVAGRLGVKIVGRARKMKLIAGGEETVLERLCVHNKDFFFYQTEGAFSQPNAAVCEKMITWAAEQSAEKCQGTDLLELYCGGGTFTAPLASQFRKVLATEISKASVDLAMRTFAKNNITNIKIARLSSEEFTEAWVNQRPFKRLIDNGIDLTEYDIQTVLVDPPRAGMDDGTCELVSKFARIVYISCNPETLARDVSKLLSTHTIQRVAAFDQFPYTHHLESGVYLVKKENGNVGGGAVDNGTGEHGVGSSSTATASTAGVKRPLSDVDGE